jgi:hypothetical protein
MGTTMIAADTIIPTTTVTTGRVTDTTTGNYRITAALATKTTATDGALATAPDLRAMIADGAEDRQALDRIGAPVAARAGGLVVAADLAGDLAGS